MHKWQEQIEADLLRVMYKLGLITLDQLYKAINILQVKLFIREDSTSHVHTAPTV